MPRLHEEWTLTGVAGASRIWVDGAPLKNLDSLLAGTFEDSAGALDMLSTTAPGSVEWMTAEIPPGESMQITRCSGAFDAGTLTAHAIWKQSVRGKALVPHRVYVFRACEEGCAFPLDDPRRAEVIRMVAPRGEWVATGGASREATIPRGQPFTVLETHVRPGASATLEVAYTQASGASFGPLDAEEEPPVTSVMLDVVWPERQAPTSTVYRGSLPPGPSARTPTSRRAPDCADPNMRRGPTS